MEKNIKDYLHYYLGCEIIGTYNDQSGSRGYLTGILNGGIVCEIQFLLEDGINVSEEPEYNSASEVKPILRKLESMTKDEAISLLRIAWPISNIIKIHEIGSAGIKFLEGDNERQLFPNEQGWVWFSINQFHYLLSKGFDLFSLIESGLAIEKQPV